MLFTIFFIALPIMAHAGDSDPIFGGEASGTFQVAVQSAQVDVLNFDVLWDSADLICPRAAGLQRESNFDKLAMAQP